MLYRLSSLMFELVIRILFKVRVFGKENVPPPPFIAAANHASLVDPPLVAMVCNKYFVNFMAKKELFDLPIIGAWTRAVRCIEVHRGRNSVRSLKEALRRVKNGEVVGVFPEGTRSVDGTLQDAKRGTGFLIEKAGVPVVPIFIEGSGKALLKGGGMTFRARINVYVGKPIRPEEFLSRGSEGNKYEDISRELMKHIACLGEHKNPKPEVRNSKLNLKGEL